jgi:cytochrome c-type biogenesis protein
MLLLVALLGQKLTRRLAGASDPHGWFKRSLGVLFLVVGIAIFLGYDKMFEAYLLEIGVYDGIGNIEGQLLDTVDNQ